MVPSKGSKYGTFFLGVSPKLVFCGKHSGYASLVFATAVLGFAI